MTQSNAAENPDPANGDETMSKKRLRLWLGMLRTARRIELILRERLKTEFDATLPRFDVLAVLDRCEGGMTMTKLSQRLMVSNGNVTGIVDRLEEEGHVKRVTNERDRRATLVALTANGRAVFQEMAAAHETWIDELLGIYSAEEVGALTDLLRILREEQKMAEDAKIKKKGV
ncbi:MarR family transcriptional regulator [Rhodospirillaceae bacterium KN72]|uniref:MarR family transcriptional regulator n=1 Tax=Pacificispira spongiicola TaxID=2729598 RepID=A0A7Y0E2P4_9PROT|nr:MarR family transcriptional regulator [Pacificispira spongiicola]NMM45391.1 MarR family transcriptional regulator [Pacificispira spongiicola]